VVSTAPPAPPLTTRLKWSYALGSTAEAVAFTASSSFLLLFYNQVLGLPADKVGIALSLGLFVNAVFDPLVGSWSDRTRSRWGRRHPFMFASILPAALCFYAVFNPPDTLSDMGKLIWLGAMNTMLMQAMTLYHTPHLAMGGELSGGYLGRTSVMAYNTFCLWLGDTIGWLLAFRVFFAATEQFPNGALDPSRYPAFSISIALLIAGLLFYSSWSTRSRIRYLPQVAAETPRFGGRSLMRDVGRTLSNRNYIMLLIGLAFLSMMVGVRIGLGIYSNSYYWQLTNDEISYFVIASFAGYVFAASVVVRMHDRFDKRWSAAIALALYCIGPVLPLLLGLAGILSPSTPGLIWILIAFALLQHFPYSVMTTTIYSALADIADENELKYGMRQEGIFYSTRTFFQRVDQALGTALAGWVLSRIAFPSGVKPGEVPQPILDDLALALLISTIPGLIAAVFYGMIRVTRKTHEATRAAIDARNAEAEAAG
jgi:glycoside/pentoside/hexuronide:cation symporter, GPH family